MLNLLISIIGIVVTLLVIIGIHEAGHFFVAKLLGIKVLRFSLGFGKALLRWHDKTGTEYVVAAIPLGGYVKMLDENEDPVPAKELPFAFNRQPLYKRTAVIIAGPLANMLLAFLLYWALFMLGFTSILPIIGKVAPHSIAAEAGIQSQQEIISIDNHATPSWIKVIIKLLPHVGNKNYLQITTKSLATQQTKAYTLNLVNWKMDNLKPDPLESLGITPYVPPQTPWPKEFLRKNQYPPLIAFTYAWDDTITFIKLNFLMLGKLFSGKISLESLSGPIAIFGSAGAALNKGVVPFIGFLAYLSIAIGIVNILPIPGLDGGHLVFQLIELIMRRPVSLRVQLLFYRIGIIILLLLITQAVVNDLLRL